MRAIFAAIVCLALAGCTTYRWAKPGATEADLQRDSYECERDVRQSGYYGGGLLGALNAEGFGERCMMAHGWRAVPNH